MRFLPPGSRRHGVRVARVHACAFELAKWPGHHTWCGFRCCPQQLFPHAAQLIYHAFFANLVQSLGDLGFDTKAILGFADLECKVGNSGEKEFLRVNGLVMLTEVSSPS